MQSVLISLQNRAFAASCHVYTFQCLQVVCKKVFASWYRSSLWIYFHLGWRFGSWALRWREVSFSFIKHVFFFVHPSIMVSSLDFTIHVFYSFPFTLFSNWCSVWFTRYIQLVKKYGLEISQPGLEPNNGLTWEMTKRRGDREAHKYSLSPYTLTQIIMQL